MIKYAFTPRRRADEAKANARLTALCAAHPELLREPGPSGLTPQDKALGIPETPPAMRPSTIAYRAYHAGFITARQARPFGCNLQNAGTGTKREALNRQLRKRAGRS